MYSEIVHKLTIVLAGALRSKTIWFNLLFVAVIFAEQYGYSEFQPGTEIAVMGNILLRFLTKTGLAQK